MDAYLLIRNRLIWVLLSKSIGPITAFSQFILLGTTISSDCRKVLSPKINLTVFRWAERSDAYILVG